mmetsp:Transcript_5068/g.16044  ORF Transcript_5068/g.16044 Transcript_5068/m.16044 type:complete len:258 (+) Transcript_5068:2425-3198(+)
MPMRQATRVAPAAPAWGRTCESRGSASTLSASSAHSTLSALWRGWKGAPTWRADRALPISSRTCLIAWRKASDWRVCQHPGCFRSAFVCRLWRFGHSPCGLQWKTFHVCWQCASFGEAVRGKCCGLETRAHPMEQVGRLEFRKRELRGRKSETTSCGRPCAYLRLMPFACVPSCFIYLLTTTCSWKLRSPRHHCRVPPRPRGCSPDSFAMREQRACRRSPRGPSFEERCCLSPASQDVATRRPVLSATSSNGSCKRT